MSRRLNRGFGFPLAVLAMLVMTSLLLGLGGCGQTKPKRPDPQFELVIGDLVPLGGPLKPFGPPGKKAADLAVREIRKTLRERGSPIKVTLKHANVGTDPKAAVKAARKLVSRDGATCLTGAWASAVTVEVGRSVAARRKVPLISPASTSDAVTNLADGGFVFRTAPPDKLQARALAKAIARDAGRSASVVIGARGEDYGRDLARYFSGAWRASGGKVLKQVIYRPNKFNYKHEARLITRTRPDRYVIIDYPLTYARLGPALTRSRRFSAAKTWVTDGLAASNLPKQAGRSATDGLRGTAPGAPRTGEAAIAFGQTFRGAPGAERQVFDSNNFDAVMLCFLAANAAGSSNGVAIKNKLTAVSGPPGKTVTFKQLGDAMNTLADEGQINYRGPSGPIDFDRNGDPQSAVYDIFTYRRAQIKSIGQVKVRSRRGAKS